MSKLFNFKKYIFQTRKKQDLTFNSFQQSLKNLFLNLHIPDDNNVIIISKKDEGLIFDYKNIAGLKQVYYFEINEEGGNLADIGNTLYPDDIRFDISVLSTTEFSKNEYLDLEKKVLDSKVIVFSFDNYFKRSFNDFDDLNNYFKSKGFQLFSMSNKRLYSLNVSKDEYNNYDVLSLFAIKKINLLKIIDEESEVSFSFRDN